MQIREIFSNFVSGNKIPSLRSIETKLSHIAVIIPTLNEERYIDRCLQSVTEQSYPMELLDILIVDGGSTDRTHEMVQAWSVRFPNIRWVPNPRRIQSAAFNIGIEASTAPISVRMDAHATYDKDYIRLCEEALQSVPNVGNAGGGIHTVPTGDSLMARANAILNRERFGIGGAAFRVGTTAGEVDTVPFGAFHRSVIEQVGGMREDLERGEDNEYNARLRNAGYKIWFDPRIQCYYYTRPTLALSCKQMYANGVSIGELCYKEPSAVSMRHLTPLLFVTSMVVSICIGLFHVAGWWMLSGILGTYIVAALGADMLACKRNGWEYFLVLPLMFLCVHVSYGTGTIVGLIKRKK